LEKGEFDKLIPRSRNEKVDRSKEEGGRRRKGKRWKRNSSTL